MHRNNEWDRSLPGAVIGPVVVSLVSQLSGSESESAGMLLLPGRSSSSLQASESLLTSTMSMGEYAGLREAKAANKTTEPLWGFSKRLALAATSMAANVVPAPAIANQLKYSDAIYLKV